MSDNNKNLFYLDDLSKYKVDSDDPDVRGWDVIDADDRKIGKVDGLLANKETKHVVYLDVEADTSLIEAEHKVYDQPAGEGTHEILNEDGENHLIIPIGLVRLHEDNKKVRTEDVKHDTFSRTKRMRKGAEVDREYEVMVLGHYLPARKEDDVHPDSEGFYKHEAFNPKRV